MNYFIRFFLISIHVIQIDSLSNRFDTIVVFGNGNTDIGNTYNLTNHQWPLVPPYYQGRFSNGPVWIDNLKFSNILNYAYGDSTIDNDNLMVGYAGLNQTAVPGIRQQIVDYLTSYDISKTDLSRTLYIIWADGIEYFLDANLTAEQVITSLYACMHDLLVVNIEHLIVINLPPLQFYPGRDNDSGLSSLVQEHNSYLSANLSNIQLEYSKESIKIFDIYSLITNIMFNYSSNLNLNTINNCWTIENFILISQCTNPDEYMFIDKFHYTRIIHGTIANSIYQFILSMPSSSARHVYISKIILFICLLFCMKK